MAKHIHIHLPARKAGKVTKDRKAKDAALGKLIQTITDGNASVKVFYNDEWEEYVCRLFVNGKDQGEGPAYYTDDKSDALSTAKDMARRAKTGDAGFTTYDPREVARLDGEIKEMQEKIKAASKTPIQKRDLEQVLAKLKAERAKYHDACSGQDAFPTYVKYKGSEYSRTGKYGTNNNSGKPSAEYEEIDKEGKRSGKRIWLEEGGKITEDSCSGKDSARYTIKYSETIGEWGVFDWHVGHIVARFKSEAEAKNWIKANTKDAIKPYVSGGSSGWEVLNSDGKVVKTFPKTPAGREQAQAYLKQHWDELYHEGTGKDSKETEDQGRAILKNDYQGHKAGERIELLEFKGSGRWRVRFANGDTDIIGSSSFDRVTVDALSDVEKKQLQDAERELDILEEKIEKKEDQGVTVPQADLQKRADLTKLIHQLSTKTRDDYVASLEHITKTFPKQHQEKFREMLRQWEAAGISGPSLQSRIASFRVQHR